ncbi:MAG: proton-conducting transporter membrane subunit [Desulfuromonadales bacterium]|nr:proton-conducting transporter membrane subunit [Desulfuromonadales bacterium]
MMLLFLILFPLLLGTLALFLPSERLRCWLLPLAGTLHLGDVVVIACNPLTGNLWIGLDALSLLVLLVTSTLYFACSIYAVSYLQLRSDRGTRTIVACLLIFLSAMTLATAARHLGLLWMAVEATTIASAPLIYYNRNRLSIEATWKYLLICSVGIALALLGMLFLAYAALLGGVEVTLQFDHLLAESSALSTAWLRAGFVFLLVGFGTKMGLAPLHSWKPDAYGEAPGMIGALLAGGLTSISFLAILRAVQVMNAAGLGDLARQQLLVLGVLSLLVAAIFMVRQNDVKRMLAYSSVEHMGILAIGIGIGGLATFGALLHLVNNALTKGCMFLSVGNIHRAFASKKITDIHGAMRRLPISGTIFLAGFFAVTGSPPFGPFISEFTILRGIFADNHYWLAGAFLLLLAIVFIGMGSTVLGMVQGTPDATTDPAFQDTFLLVAPPLLLLLLVLLLGLYLPPPLRRLLEDAVVLLEVQ